jgi:hypothetical protein
MCNVPVVFVEDKVILKWIVGNIVWLCVCVWLCKDLAQL